VETAEQFYPKKSYRSLWDTLYEILNFGCFFCAKNIFHNHPIQNMVLKTSKIETDADD
jgi:hypothetical protein